MKKCLIILFVLMPISVFAGLSSSRSTSVEEVDSFLADLDSRTSIIPSDSFQVYSESQWINDELEKIQSLKNNENRWAKSLEKELQDAEAALNSFRDRLGAIKPDDLEGLNKLILEQLQPTYSSIEILAASGEFLGYQSESDFSNTFAKEPFKQLVDESGDSLKAATKENHQSVYQALLTKFLPSAEKNFRYIKDASIKEAANKKLISEKLASAESKILSYRKALMSAANKAETKNDLRSNLYLMILVIGGLSIGAIALVRWFPAQVMLEWVESGQVIQFVTVMILLSVIMALGLAGLLTENTLGTLLGGIGGYVLSQGVGRSAARTAIKERDRELKANKQSQSDA